MPWQTILAAVPLLAEGPAATDYGVLGMGGIITALLSILTIVFTKTLPGLVKGVKELLMLVREDNFKLIERVETSHKEEMTQVSTDRHAQNNALHDVVGKFEIIATEQRLHDAEEGKFERLQCEKHIGTLADSVRASSAAMASALEGQANAVEGLKQAVQGMVAVSKASIEKSGGTA